MNQASLRSLSIVLTFLLLLFSQSQAKAGQLFVIDDAGILSASDVAALSDSAATLPFALKIITAKNYTDRNIFTRIVRSNLPDEQTVVVGLSINPAARVFLIEPGEHSGLAERQAREIVEESSGPFKKKQWRESIFLLLSRLRYENYVAATSPVREAVTDSTLHPTTAPTSGKYSAIIALFILAILAIIFVFWRNTRNRRIEQRAKTRPRNVNSPY